MNVEDQKRIREFIASLQRNPVGATLQVAPSNSQQQQPQQQPQQRHQQDKQERQQQSPVSLKIDDILRFEASQVVQQEDRQVFPQRSKFELSMQQYELQRHAVFNDPDSPSPPAVLRPNIFVQGKTVSGQK